MDNENASSERETSENRTPSHVGLSALLGGLFEFVCEQLPDDWVLRLDVMADMASIELIDPAGKTVDMCDDGTSPEQMIVNRVNHARAKDGLGAVEP